MRMRKVLFKLWKGDSERKISRIKGLIDPGDRIIDIGAGPCWVTYFLREKGYDIIPVDVEDLSIFDVIRPIIFNGSQLPFHEKEFHVSLLLTVLHHCVDPVDLLWESSRISRRVIIIEDIYSNRFMELITKIADSLMNLHFMGHPHSNRTDAQWRSIFDELGLELEYSRQYRIGGIFTQVIYAVRAT